MNGQKILLLDDDEPIRKALTVRLSHAGYQLLTANDAFTASALINEEQPILMVLDINMPGADGFQFAELVDQNFSTFIPRIFITASRSAEIHAKAKSHHAHALFEKPFSSHALINEIQHVLANDEQNKLETQRYIQGS